MNRRVGHDRVDGGRRPAAGHGHAQRVDAVGATGAEAEDRRGVPAQLTAKDRDAVGGDGDRELQRTTPHEAARRDRPGRRDRP